MFLISPKTINLIRQLTGYLHNGDCKRSGSTLRLGLETQHFNARLVLELLTMQVFADCMCVTCISLMTKVTKHYTRCHVAT